MRGYCKIIQFIVLKVHFAIAPFCNQLIISKNHKSNRNLTEKVAYIWYNNIYILAVKGWMDMDIFRIFELRDIIDITLVAIVIYKLAILIRDTRAMQLVKGILVLIVATQLSTWFGLDTLNYILKNAMTVGVISIVVVFQPELRRALEQLGRGTFFEDMLATDQMEAEIKMKNCINELCITANELSKKCIGALIIIERQTKIGDVVRSGVELDGLVSSAILQNIFIPNTPLHDGAVVIRENRIVASACLLPLTENTNLSRQLGTRHRAAIGISENSDCIALVVSEETGTISVAVNGKLTRDLTRDSLNKFLTGYIIRKKNEKDYKAYLKRKISFRKGTQK
jgi:diadenylate cyclase